MPLITEESSDGKITTVGSYKVMWTIWDVTETKSQVKKNQSFPGFLSTLNRKYLHRINVNWSIYSGNRTDMKSCYNYQIIKTLIKFEKEIRHRLHVLIKNKITVSSAKCETTSRARDAFCPLTQARRVNCPFNLCITMSNYKHDAYSPISAHIDWW